MPSSSEILKTLLKQNGYSVTKQRLLVFNLLLGQEPMSMRALINTASKQIDKVSIYRTIAVFERIGIVHRLTTGWKYKIELTDKFSEHHHHLTCLRCKKVTAINTQALEVFIDQLALRHEFLAKEHQVEIQGYCKTCLPLIKMDL